jgi:ATP-dependent DNA helicase 2 subunit 2
MGSVLRLGDLSLNPDMAFEIMIKTSKCTAVARPKSWKKFSIRYKKNKFGKMEADDDAMDVDAPPKNMVYNQLKLRRTFNLFDETQEEQENEAEDTLPPAPKEDIDRLNKDDLIRGFSYGTTYVPCPDGQFPRLETKKGIDICGFFKREHFKRELSMGEIQYVWADPASPKQQVALSSIVQAMANEDLYAIVRWVTKDGVDAKMGVLAPVQFESVDCLLWAQMPFADDVRKYTFSSLERLVNKKGETLKEHPYLPTDNQMKAMEHFVDAMDLSDAGGKDEEGNPIPWFDTRLSYNPALHRVKQAMFHCAVVTNLDEEPVPPPHPTLLQYWKPPRRVMKRARQAIDDCITELAVKEVPKKVARTKKNEHVHANDEDDEPLLLDALPSNIVATTQPKMPVDEDSATEDESEGELLLENTKPEKIPPHSRTPPGKLVNLPTPDQSPEPDPGRAEGRIIGSTSPLKDFQYNLKEGDLVDKVVEDLAAVIRDIVKKPFSLRRTKELLECMRALRDTCLQEDEIPAWNKFLQDLKRDCAEDPGNVKFWSEVRNQGRELSLISKNEAAKQGGQSPFSEEEAEQFFDI